MAAISNIRNNPSDRSSFSKKIFELADDMTKIMKEYGGTLDWIFSCLAHSPDAHDKRIYVWFTSDGRIAGLSSSNCTIRIATFDVQAKFLEKVTAEMLKVCSAVCFGGGFQKRGHETG